MLRCLVIGDPHIQKRHLSRVEKMINEIVRVARETEPDIIIVLGDILHTHSKIDEILQNMAYDFLEELGRIRPTYVLIGNHDRINNSDNQSPIHPFRGLEFGTQLREQISSNPDLTLDLSRIPSVTVAWEILDKTIHGFRILFAPYVPDGEFHTALSRIPDPYEADCIFAHQMILGCKLNFGYVAETGDEWPPDAPMVFSGHVHGYQLVKDNWLYIGAPIQHDYDDANNRALSMLTFTRNEKSFDWKEERLPLKVPTLVQQEIAIAELDDVIVPPNCHLKLKVIGTTAEFKAVPNSRWTQLKKAGVLIEKKTLGVSRTPQVDIRVGFSSQIRKKSTPRMKKELQRIEKLLEEDLDVRNSK